MVQDMNDPVAQDFIIDCNVCKAKVAAESKGSVINYGGIDEDGEPFYGRQTRLGVCRICRTALIGIAQQVDIEGVTSYQDEWSDIQRIYPEPSKMFSSTRLPKAVRISLDEADKALQANANLAACLMLGRALEGVCRNVIDQKNAAATPPIAPSQIMLAKGITELHKIKVIDDRLYEWSKSLHFVRNQAAHPDEDANVSREDTKDLQTFTYAIIEYIYDLTDRYEEYRAREAKKVATKAKKKSKP